jgi:hypothetical protein
MVADKMIELMADAVSESLELRMGRTAAARIVLCLCPQQIGVTKGWRSFARLFKSEATRQWRWTREGDRSN